MEGLTEEERWNVACRTVEHWKEHGDKWKLNEELESPVVGAHSTPSSLTEAHNQSRTGETDGRVTRATYGLAHIDHPTNKGNE